MKKTHLVLGIIFLVTITARLLLAFSLPNLTYDSYFHLRQVEHIRETGLPLYLDPLSYGGRELTFLPLFHYLAAFFSFFLPLPLVAKLFPNLCLASLTIISYLLALKITNKETPSLFAAGIAGFLPITFSTNIFSPFSFFLPLIFLIIYAFLRRNEERFFLMYLVLFLLASFTSPITIVLLLGFAIYALLLFLEQKPLPAEEGELMLASAFFFLWSQFLFFNKTLLQEGWRFIWQNIPPAIVADYFPHFSLPQAVLAVSAIPFLASCYVIYRSLFQTHHRELLLMVSVALAAVLMTFLPLLQFDHALSFFGIITAILFATIYGEGEQFLKKTKGALLSTWFPGIIFLLLAATTIVPAINTTLTQERPGASELELFSWLRDHTPPNSTILAPLQEGHLLTKFGKRRNIMDDQFSLVIDTGQRFQDITTLYTTPFKTEALSLLEKYDVKYLTLTPQARTHFNISQLPYLSPDCFRQVYSENDHHIYQRTCSLKQN